MKRYRLYVDESGDHTYSEHFVDPAGRYLSLTGIAIEQEYYRTTFHPKLESLKQGHFPHSPDDPVILVRKRIISRWGPFGRLSDPRRNSAWEQDFLAFLNDAQAVLFTVVIDKHDHLARYGQAAYHPYHHCLTVLVERLRGFLNVYGGQADIMAESRGKREDSELQAAYGKVWNNGTWYISGQEFRKVLTSKDIKFRKKEHNIAGLQLADLIAAPSKMDILVAHNRVLSSSPSRFTARIIQVIRRKYNPYGQVFF